VVGVDQVDPSRGLRSTPEARPAYLSRPSLLIRHGESVKVVQARLGHASATETLDTYSHLWPDSEDQTRAAIDGVLLAVVSDLCQMVAEDS
jgi:integrase